MMSSLTTAFHTPYLHFTAIGAAASFLCLILILHRFFVYLAELRRKWNPGTPYDPTLLKFKRRAFTFWLILLIPSLLLLWFAVYLTQYQWIGDNVETVGEVTFHHGALQLRAPDGRISTYPVKGTRQAAAGLFLQFPHWMRSLGLSTYHQLIGFRSPEETEVRYNKATPEYISRFGDAFFCWVYSNESSFATAKYTESPYFTGSGHRISVTHNGYIVQ